MRQLGVELGVNSKPLMPTKPHGGDKSKKQEVASSKSDKTANALAGKAFGASHTSVKGTV